MRKRKHNKKLLPLLLVSLMLNVLLLASCLYLFSQFRESYINYRHYRALAVGTTEASTAQASNKDIVLYGDSRIATWNPKLVSDKYRIINAGVSGETTTEMLRRFENDVLRLAPEYVLIQAGMNDLSASVTKGIFNADQYIPTMYDNLSYFISTLEKQNIEVLVTSIIPNKRLSLMRRTLWHHSLSERVKNANAELQKMAESLGADWIDLDPLFLDDAGQPVTKLYYDTLHLNYEGYDVLNEFMQDYLKNLK